jgi:hypothetical protein
VTNKVNRIDHLILHRIFDSKFEVETSLVEYNGPKSTFESMITGCTLEEFGINVMVGPSKTIGNGLYISLSDDVDEATLPAGGFE